jgi:hypothetical protein
MNIDDLALFHGGFAVVETDRSWYLGTLAVDAERNTVIIYTGYTGRPPVLNADDVQDVVLAHDHPHVAAA